MVCPRLDAYLTDEKFFESRNRASRAVRNGYVTVNGETAIKPSLRVVPGDKVTVLGNPLPYVSKAALKLRLFLDETDLDVSGLKICDAGSSTGGFSQILLLRGASFIWAVDVGTGQLHPSLAGDPRLSLHEKCDIRDFLTAPPQGLEMITADLSFISLRRVIPIMAGAGVPVLLLFKPQFETPPHKKNKRGVVTHLRCHETALDSFRDYLLKEGFFPLIIKRSQVLGGEGNREYFIFCERKASAVITPDDIKREVYKDEDFLDL
jgi:23S rRNA (cytidine1920-2'-O)/16S rRNA (cytidine1409-2'-O)-methyltransferase